MARKIVQTVPTSSILNKLFYSDSTWCTYSSVYLSDPFISVMNSTWPWRTVSSKGTLLNTIRANTVTFENSFYSRAPRIWKLYQSKGKGQYIQLPVMGKVWTCMKVEVDWRDWKKGNKCMRTVTNINSVSIIPPFSLLTTLYLIYR